MYGIYKLVLNKNMFKKILLGSLMLIVSLTVISTTNAQGKSDEYKNSNATSTVENGNGVNANDGVDSEIVTGPDKVDVATDPVNNGNQNPNDEHNVSDDVPVSEGEPNKTITDSIETSIETSIDVVTNNHSRSSKNKIKRPLSVGTSGDDVKSLQEFLNTDPSTQIASNGSGSKGKETGYYGSLTAEAVGKFQIKHDIVSGSNDAGYGVVGPRTMAAIDNNFIYRIGNTPNVLSDEQRIKIIERLRAIVEQVTLMQQKLKEQGV